MAYTVSFGTTNKRINSTKIPALGNLMPCVLKHPCDLESPTIVVQLNSIPSNWNMFYISELASYFWISSVVAIGNGRYQITGKKDVLSTYKSDILNTNAYIEYGFNETTARIADPRPAVDIKPTVLQKSKPMFGDIVSQSGVYLLTCTGSNGDTRLWKINESGINGILDAINTTIGSALTETGGDVGKILEYVFGKSLVQGNSVQAIRNCIWLPIAYSAVPSKGRGFVHLGSFSTEKAADKVSINATVTASVEVEIGWKENDWRRLSHQLSLYIPYIGLVTIPVDKCNDVDKLQVRTVVELATGTAQVNVYAGARCIYVGNASIATQFPIGQNIQSLQRVLSGVGTAVGSGITAGLGVTSGNPSFILGGISSAVAGAGQIITPQMQYAGSLSGNATIGQGLNIILTSIYYQPIEYDKFKSIYGHPVMSVAKPVLGYCKTQGFSVAGDAMDSDKNEINRYMDTGVFIE